MALAQLKQRWGTMQRVLSSRSRLEQIVADILLDMETRDRLQSGHGNAMLVSDSIYNGLQVLRTLHRTRLRQVRHRHLLQTLAGGHQGRGNAARG